jgi:imidazolonepropionase-like amidohydrolase
MVLVNGLLIDGTGAEALPDAVLIVREGRIAEVGPQSQVNIPAGAQVIDVQGAAILPGIINTHVHRAYDENNLRLWLQGGVTTVREMGMLSDNPQAIKDAYELAEATLRRPELARIVSATPMITVPGGYGHLEIESAEEARQRTLELIEQGADLAKISFEDYRPPNQHWPLLPMDYAQAIARAAHERGVPVSVHITWAKYVPSALEAGADDIAHMAMDPITDEMISAVIQAGVTWVPTLELYHGVGGRTFENALENTRRFVAAGGKIALGTDYAGYYTPFQLGMPILEMELLKQTGMTPMQIITAATRDAAQVCNLEDELGTLEAGKIADILVVDGNPLEDLGAMLKVRMVMRNGVIGYRPQE